MNEIAFSRPATSFVNPDIQQTVMGFVNDYTSSRAATILVNYDIQQTVRGERGLL